MKKSEELAYKEYPYKEGYDVELPYPSSYDENSEERKSFIKGYEQAIKEVEKWLRNNVDNYLLYDNLPFPLDADMLIHKESLICDLKKEIQGN